MKIIIELDVRKYPVRMSSFNIRLIPSLAIFKSGDAIREKSAVPANKILYLLNLVAN